MTTVDYEIARLYDPVDTDLLRVVVNLYPDMTITIGHDDETDGRFWIGLRRTVHRAPTAAELLMMTLAEQDEANADGLTPVTE